MACNARAAVPPQVLDTLGGTAVAAVGFNGAVIHNTVVLGATHTGGHLTYQHRRSSYRCRCRRQHYEPRWCPSRGRRTCVRSPRRQQRHDRWRSFRGPCRSPGTCEPTSRQVRKLQRRARTRWDSGTAEQHLPSGRVGRLPSTRAAALACRGGGLRPGAESGVPDRRRGTLSLQLRGAPGDAGAPAGRAKTHFEPPSPLHGLTASDPR